MFIKSVDKMVDLFPLISALGNKNLTENHWTLILTKLEGGFSLIQKVSFSLKEMLDLGV